MAKLKPEVVEEVIEEVIEQVPDIVEATKNLAALRVQYATLGLAVGVAAGAVGGAMLAIRKARKEAEQYITDTVMELTSEMREDYNAKVRALDARTKESAEQMVQDLGYTSPNGQVHVEEEPETESVFDKDDPQPTEGWDLDAETANRGPVNPYVIHHDEFMINDDGNEQISLTYFAGDDVLVDERDQVMREVESTVGLENLQKFGHGSNDPLVVYIRNPRLEVDYEISRSDGTFATEVHGFQDDELKHSERHQRRRRFDDEPGH